MNEITNYFIENNHTLNIIFSIGWLIITILVVTIINRLLFRYIDDNSRYHIFRKRIYYLFSGVYLIILWVLWAQNTAYIATYVGLLSAGIAIALKDLFANIAAWFFIMIRKPFEIGQRVLIGDSRGDVIDIRLFQFSLMEVTDIQVGEQSTGRIVDIPNHYVFVYPTVNYTKGFKYIWNEISVLITFESDWELAKEKLTEIVNHHALHFTEEAAEQIKSTARKYMILYNNLTPIVYTDVKESGVELTLRYLCLPKQRRDTNNDIWEDILRLISDASEIDLAYPTLRHIV
ncbi:mechanosensitive ion channel family protein [Acetobacterium carbinolicum]|jgi:small-conductance mechanosensitive channel|uniref:mechanosensitive ion channel family protein n=1 Tax=Acetobacterium TaxID=33951 RepID=UPI000DBEB50C|nr:mechanosensitive ion channel domain-containing protein [Acetobacterium sp. KB-1]AWW25771.1 mechanosensitive ion channel family protein [Acetobacterium sp. KB-1]